MERSEKMMWEGNEQVQPGLRAWRIKDELKLEELIAWEIYCCLIDNENNSKKYLWMNEWMNGFITQVKLQ